MTVVTESLHESGIHFEVLHHPEADTSAGEAIALGVPAADVAKTIVLDTSGGHALAVVPASCRIDLMKLRTAANDHHVHLANEDEMESDYPQFELGGVPPLGELLHARVFVDPAVMRHENIVFAAGSRSESVRVRTDELFKGDNVVVAALTLDPDEDAWRRMR